MMLIDIVINDIVDKRPANPYMSIAQAMESRTMPEIINIELYPRVVGNGACGVHAKITTNITTFNGYASYEYEELTDSTSVLKDFTVIQEKVKEVMKNVDPRDLIFIDKILPTISGMDATISLAISIAACRAGARHKNMSLYRFEIYLRLLL